MPVLNCLKVMPLIVLSARMRLLMRSASGIGAQSIGTHSKRSGDADALRLPLDPECPVVAEFMGTLFGDPTMAMGAPVEDITEEFERRHRKQCKRCQEYGLRQRVAE